MRNMPFRIRTLNAISHAGLTRNICDFRIEVTVVREHLDGSAQDGPALIGDDGTFRV